MIRANRFARIVLRIACATKVPVFGSGGSSAKRVFCVSVQVNREGHFRFRFRFLENGSGGSGSASRTKNQPKEEVFGTDIPRTSGGHSRGYPGPKLRSGWSKSWKNKHFGADIHDPKARTSTTLRDFQKLRSEKLWAEFSFPSFSAAQLRL